MESTDCGNLCPYEKGTQKIEVCDQLLNMKSENVHVDMDMEPFSHLTTKDLNFNSRFNLQRSLSRKVEDKKMSNPRFDNETDAIASHKVIVGITEPQVHHQISIITSTTATTVATTTATATAAPTKSRLIAKRSSSFKQTSVINPRRILFFFATLSSMGTILLIYFTLSMARHNGDNNLLDE
ncbi:uncharacterized protein LOC112520362 [Cynara cardunculus var. scolymus]|uniref:uncharacterized protein LOC112520362 n=1 Tax=Cynara cardunculus var. scolymus TaxID=59895 RepID=UPI000D62D6AF|nr:uncharacterized protein LOC112520362 [Cynara cardunculus var. scolymus]